MNPKPQRSLKSLIFLHEAALLCLVVLTGLIGGVSAYFWKSSSEESLRIHSLFAISEQIRGELYAQIQGVIRVRVLEDPDALEVHGQYSRTIDRHFNTLRQRSASNEEDLVIQDMQHAYREIQQDMNRIFRDPYRTNRQARVMLLNPKIAGDMVGRFEGHHARLKALLDSEHQELDKILHAWSRFAPVVIPFVVICAVLLVLFTRRTVHREFIAPMSTVLDGAETLSQGQLQHSIPEAGVVEISSLAGTLNSMAAELQISRDALVKSERQAALGALVPVVAHNIRNPMASIRATAQLIDDQVRPEELLESRNMIISTIDRLGHWVNALVSYLHPLQPNLRSVMSSELLQSTLDILSEKLQAKAMRVQREGWEHDQELMVDPDLMEQALYALMQNAVDASPTDSVLILRMVVREGHLELHIIDRGPGLRFKPAPGKLEPGPSTKRYGTGLGIPIAFKICQTHGWNIQFAEAAAGGTEVTVVAPLGKVPAQVGEAS